MEIRATENNIIPFHRPEEKEIEIVKWVNQPNILLRNAKAKAYIESCKESCKEKENRFETFWLFVSGICAFAPILALYFLGTMF